MNQLNSQVGRKKLREVRPVLGQDTVLLTGFSLCTYVSNDSFILSRLPTTLQRYLARQGSSLSSGTSIAETVGEETPGRDSKTKISIYTPNTVYIQ